MNPHTVAAVVRHTYIGPECPGDDCGHPEHPSDICLVVVEDRDGERPCGCQPRCGECQGWRYVVYDDLARRCATCLGDGAA